MMESVRGKGEPFVLERARGDSRARAVPVVMRWIPEKVAEILNRLAVVEWDRAITAPVETDDGELHEMTIVYGWIPRDDGQRDYVQLDFPSWSDMPGFATSSALYSERMNRIIYGPDAPHYPCVKVAETPIGPLVERKARWAE